MKADASNLDPRVKKLIWILSVSAVLAIGVIVFAVHEAHKAYQASSRTRSSMKAMLDLFLAANDPEKEESILSGEMKVIEARMLASNKKYEQAHEAYTDAVRSFSASLTPVSPTLSQIYCIQGQFECDFEKWDRAEAAFRCALKSLRADGRDEEEALKVKEWLVYVLRQARKDKEALALAMESLTRTEKAHLDAGSILIELAKTEEMLRKFPESEAHFTRAISLHPDKAAYYYDRADLYSWQGLYEKALADHQKALSIDPNNAHRHFSCAHDYKAVGRLKNAVEQYTLAIALDPKYECAYEGRASVYHELGQYADELQDLNQILKLDSKDASNYALRGDCYERLDQHHSALRDYNAAIGLAGHKERIWDTVGGSKFDKSLKVYTYEKRAKVFDALGRPDQSAADIKIARRIEAVCRTMKIDENTKTK